MQTIEWFPVQNRKLTLSPVDLYSMSIDVLKIVAVVFSISCAQSDELDRVPYHFPPYLTRWKVMLLCWL